MAATESAAQAPDQGQPVTRRLVVAGTGEHARVVAEVARAAGWEPVGAIGPQADERAAGALPYLGTDEEAAQRFGADDGERPAVVLGFGGPVSLRRGVVERLGDAMPWATVIHPAAWVSPSATVGEGAVILAGAIVGTGATVGAHVIVNSGAIVEHDVRVGAHAHIGPGAAIGGGAAIGDGTFVGLNASVRDHVTIGAGVTVGMGAAVVADLPDGATVMGVPARG